MNEVGGNEPDESDKFYGYDLCVKRDTTKVVITIIVT